MEFLKRLSWFILCLVITASAYATNHHQAVKPQTHEYRPVTYFSSIEVGESFKVFVTHKAGKQELELIGFPDALQQVIVAVEGHRLTLQLERPDLIPPPHRHIIVRVTTPGTLSSIYAFGSAEVIISDIYCPNLAIYAKDWGQVIVHGKVVLQKIETCSARNVVVDWTNSRHVIIAASGLGRVYVHGHTGVLSARTRGNACLEAQHLRAYQVYVEAFQTSIAKVFPIYSLYAFAGQSGNIFYYHKPRILMRHTEQSGNVLQVANRPL